MSEQAAPNLQALREALSAAATLGTERRPFRPPQADGALGAALARLDPANGGERALLSALALLTSYGRAGYRAPLAGAPAAQPPAPDRDVPACSPAASRHLQAMLRGDYRAVLPEWLALLAASGRRAPDYLLPDLLEAGRNTLELRPLIRGAVGLRGQWLAAQNPDWHYASVAAAATARVSPERAEALWETGTRAMRLALLEELRSQAPAAARALVESTWASEKADDRAAFLEKLRAGLSMDDEPFLETALDDRGKEVRKTAAELLAHLPDSRLVQRMIARVTPLLRWTPPERNRLLGLLQGKPGAIELTLPEACDKAMARDGVDPTPVPSGRGAGERAEWLRQMLRAIPPAYWAEQWQATPAEILAAANSQPEWSATLVSAWTDAAEASGDADWAEAILRVDPDRYALLPVLPAERQEAVLLRLLGDKQAAKTPDTILSLLRLAKGQWSVALSRAVLGMLLRRAAHPPDRLSYLLTSALTEAAYHVPLALLREIEVSAEWRDARDHWQQAGETMLSILHFRHDMQEALRA